MTPSEVDKGKTIYRLKFVPDALKEWQALDGSIKEPLRKALKKRLEQPHMPIRFHASHKPSKIVCPDLKRDGCQRTFVHDVLAHFLVHDVVALISKLHIDLFR